MTSSGHRLPDELGDREFALLRDFIVQESGIHVTEARRSFLLGRLTPRLRALGLASFSRYYEHAMASAAERQTLLDCICTNETQFFRTPSHFALIEQRLIPALVAQARAGRRARVLRVWSAGCSTGEEPYSLAMVLCWHLAAALGWGVQIIATDLSSRALQHAKRGVWPIEQATEIPENYRKRFMLRGIRQRQGTMAAGSQIRAALAFRHLNLSAPMYPVHGEFDLIFCRNVLMFLTGQVKRRVVHKLLGHLAPGGCLFLGQSESLDRDVAGIARVIPSVYTYQP